MSHPRPSVHPAPQQAAARQALERLAQSQPDLHADIMQGARECLGESARAKSFDQQVALNLHLSTEFVVKAEVGIVQVGDRFGDCVLRWRDGRRTDYLVSGVEDDARKFSEDGLLQVLADADTPGEDAATILAACW